MKTYELLDFYIKLDPERFYGTTTSMTNFLLELGYSEKKIVELLSNPITRECVEINQRTYDKIRNNYTEKKKFFKK